MRTPMQWAIVRRNGRQIALAAFVALTIIVVFLGQSRVPALTTKAQMGQRTGLGTLAFDVVIPVSDADPWFERVAYTAVNWTYTNWKGMTFGLLFAAALLTLLKYFPRHSFNSRFLNSLKGVITGAPLGVCVNCATPIAHGMFQAGVRVETVLATLVSSPTLNVIVLAMSFSLLPLHYAVAKLAAVLLFVSVVIPLISRIDRPRIDAATQRRVEDELGQSFYRSSVLGRDDAIPPGDEPASIGWLQATGVFVRDYLKALWFILRTTVPFMLLAGLLGAAVVELIPLNELGNLESSFPIALLVAVVGAFLPVPMSFDVVSVSLLIGSGVPSLLAMTLLFTLGIFSIYPLLIIGRNVSLRLALALFVSVVLVGLAAGYAVQAYDSWVNERVVSAYEKDVPQQSPATLESLRDYAPRIAIVQRVCAENYQSAERDGCVADYISAELSSGAGPELCSALQGSADGQLKDYCLNEAREGRIALDARDRADTSLCGALGEADKQTACMQEVILARLRAGEPLAYCDTLPSAKGVSWCRQQGVAIRLHRFNDVEACLQLDSAQAVRACQADARVIELSTGRRFENCDAIADAEGKARCRRLVAFDMIDDGAEVGVCEQMGADADRQECIGHAAVVAVSRSGDPRGCDQIGDASGARVCRRIAVNQRIQMQIAQLETRVLGNTVAAATGASGGARAMAALAGGTPPRRLELRQLPGSGSVTVSYFDDATRAPGTKGFERRSAGQLGIPDYWRFSMLEFGSPFMTGRGIASGDFDNDHWPDLALASNDGIHLLRNNGRGGFVPQPLPASLNVPRDAYVVAFVDLDNDGWQDLFVTGYGGRVSVVLNDRQGFKAPKSFALPNGAAILAISSAFADLDRDGDLDLLLGNWSFGEDKAFLENYSDNRLLINGPSGFTAQAMDEVRGDSLTALFSDLDGDGDVDLAVGNDREIPDMYYKGDGRGGLRRIRRADKWIPITSLNTMSIDSADVNNDLRLDVFSTDMTFSRGGQQGYCEAVADGPARARCVLLLEGRDRIARRDAAWCQGLEDERDRDDCLIAVYRVVAINTGNPELCDRIPDRQSVHREYCRNLARRDLREERFLVEDELPQKQRNRLLIGADGGGFRDATDEYGVASSFWTWNAKAADLDNDGWQDIYVGNGFHFGEGEWEIHSNVFFHNQSGKRFAQAEDEFGLADLVNTPSFVQVDFDLDGDLDIIATGVLSPVRVFVNQESSNNSISVSLRDARGNRFGIGSKVYVHYTQAGRPAHQLREIKASGGYLSFDAPVAHFGLGNARNIDTIEVLWSTGEKTVLNASLAANRHYVIERGKQ